MLEGYIFRSFRRGDRLSQKRLLVDAVNLILKKRAKAVGFSETYFRGHCFRKGIITAASRAKVPDRKMMAHGRWKDCRSLDKYIEAEERFTDNIGNTVNARGKS